MVMAGLTPNAMTYTIRITGCASTGRVDRAMELLSLMRAAGVPPNAYVYTAVITTCTKGGEWEQALHVFEQALAAAAAAAEAGDMERARSMVTTVTYNAVLAACEVGKQWEVSVHFPPYDLSASNFETGANTAVSIHAEHGQRNAKEFG